MEKSDFRLEAPALVRDFLSYLETVGGKSKKTVDEYYLDLRLFFRYLKFSRGIASKNIDFDLIPISDIDLNFIKSIKLTDIYEYLSFLSRDRATHKNSLNTKFGLNAASRARKVSSIRAFFKYLETKARLIEENPAKDLEIPRQKKSIVKYLSLDESINLLSNISGKNQIRDYCIITLFLNCGLRVSELVGLNLGDINEDMMKVLGKGNKERVIYLNEACLDAISKYLKVRVPVGVPIADKNALFLSSRHKRISIQTVKWLVKKYTKITGLDSKISAHKLRHTAATLMYRNGVDVRVLQEILGHEHLNTTQIYTHVDNENMKEAARANPLSRVKNKNT